MSGSYKKEKTYLTFEIQNRLFAVEALDVLEVLRNEGVSPVPKTRNYIKGIVNFRGEIVSVVTADQKMNIEENEMANAYRNIIILELNLNGRDIRVGMLVQNVKKVMNVSEDQIKPVPEFGTYYNPEFLKGGLKIDDQYAMILDSKSIFTNEEVEIISKETSKQ